MRVLPITCQPQATTQTLVLKPTSPQLTKRIPAGIYCHRSRIGSGSNIQNISRRKTYGEVIDVTSGSGNQVYHDVFYNNTAGVSMALQAARSTTVQFTKT